jgi:hypothetical protein
MKIDSEMFKFFEENLDQMEDLQAAFETFKRQIGDRFVKTLTGRVDDELVTDGWTFVSNQTVGQERDYCGIKLGDKPDPLRIVVTTYTRHELPFAAPFIITRTGKECPPDTREKLFESVTRSAMGNKPMWDKPDDYAINWWTYEGWPDTSRASQLSQLSVNDDNPLIGSLVDHLQKIKSAVTEVVG